MAWVAHPLVRIVVDLSAYDANHIHVFLLYLEQGANRLATTMAVDERATR